MEVQLQQESGTILVVDGDSLRRSQRVEAMNARKLVCAQVDDAVGALKQLPVLSPDVLVVALDTLAMDLDTLARGIGSMAALGHLQILAVGDARPMSATTQARIAVLPHDADAETIARECERLQGRARRRRSS